MPRRFDGCQDDACKRALYIAATRAAGLKEASGSYWQCPSIAHGPGCGMGYGRGCGCLVCGMPFHIGGSASWGLWHFMVRILHKSLGCGFWMFLKLDPESSEPSSSCQLVMHLGLNHWKIDPSSMEGCLSVWGFPEMGDPNIIQEWSSVCVWLIQYCTM